MKLKDIRIGKRLFIGFGIMNLILVGICIFGLSMITSVNGSLEQIVEKNNVLIKAAYDMKDGLNTANLTALAAFTTKDEAFRARECRCNQRKQAQVRKRRRGDRQAGDLRGGQGPDQGYQGHHGVRKKRQQQGHGVVRVREDRGGSRLICDRHVYP